MLVCVLAVAGCRADELQFKNDRRLTFVTPDAYDEVTVPLTIGWTMDDFEATGLDGSTDPGQGAFAVFVDRAPMPVGKDLAWVGRNDPACKRNPDCPDEQYLAEHGVYVTTEQLRHPRPPPDRREPAWSPNSTTRTSFSSTGPAAVSVRAPGTYRSRPSGDHRLTSS